MTEETQTENKYTGKRLNELFQVQELIQARLKLITDYAAIFVVNYKANSPDITRDGQKALVEAIDGVEQVLQGIKNDVDKVLNHALYRQEHH
jgi:hypothetical protein